MNSYPHKHFDLHVFFPIVILIHVEKASTWTEMANCSGSGSIFSDIVRIVSQFTLLVSRWKIVCQGLELNIG